MDISSSKSFPGIHPHSLEISQVATRASSLLTSEGIQEIKGFLKAQSVAGGAFQNRRGEGDLYYTLFGTGCALALGMDLLVEDLGRYFNSFEVENLTIVDLCCLIRGKALLSFLKGEPLKEREITLYSSALEKFRTQKGSFSCDGKGQGFPYGAFLALNFYQDLGLGIPQPERLLKSLEDCRTPEGTFRNPQGSQEGTLLSTIAAVLVLRQLTGIVDFKALEWISSQAHPVAGFKGFPEALLPDMLSTGIGLFTLKICGYPMEPFVEPTREFVMDHWDESGGFRANLLEDTCDCEYTYYALLALGAVGKSEN